MKKLLFAFCFFVATSAFAQTPTATATATDSPTATPTATASATATATGTPVPTPTPLAVLYVEDVEGAKKALNVNANVNSSGDVLMKTNANIGFANLVGPFFNIGHSDDPADADKFYQEVAKGGIYPGYRRNDLVIDVGFDFSLITTSRNFQWPDKNDTPLALLSDIPASNVIGEAHFDGTDPSTASVSGVITSVTAAATGVYAVTFISALADENYGVTATTGNRDNEAWIISVQSDAKTDSAFNVIAKKFNPGTLGVVLPSFAVSDPPLVTVVVYKNP